MSRCKKTGRFMKGNQFAVGNKGNRYPKTGNRNAVKHGLFATGFTVRMEKGYLIVHVGNSSGIKSYRIPPNMFDEDETGRIWVHEDVAALLEREGVQLESATQPHVKKC